MNKQAIKEVIEKAIRKRVILVDKEFEEDIKIPDQISVHEKFLANKIVQDLEDSGEIDFGKDGGQGK